ncbi:rod shape-determining protein MreD, partial [Candidatus Azambacteria bacterium]|nr:rod shape-determining protein MreD [Candidatus Azambacteria bacterium]
MKKFFALFAAAVLQATLFASLEFYGASLDVVLVLLVLWFFFHGRWMELIMPALVGGVLLDALSGAPFGVFSLGLAATMAFLGFCALLFPRENAAHLIVFVALATVWFSLMVFILLKVTGSFEVQITLLGAAVAVAYKIAGSVLLYSLRKW